MLIDRLTLIHTSGFIHFSTLYYLPQYFQVVLGYDPIRAGIFLIPFLVGMTAISWLAVPLSLFKKVTAIHSSFRYRVLLSAKLDDIAYGFRHFVKMILINLSSVKNRLLITPDSLFGPWLVALFRRSHSNHVRSNLYCSCYWLELVQDRLFYASSSIHFIPVLNF